ncbi:MAG TPA: hypothetical protein VKA59_06120 [Vicinamibacterales bacterium]|nr:hypothetical protein [Vicinamibacterales bacterium]
MFRYAKPSAAFVIAAFVIIAVGIRAGAQWLKYPSTGVPRTAAGKVNMSAPTPRTSDGKPDFSGLWLTNRPFCPTAPDPNSYLCGLELPIGLDGINIGSSLKGGLPYQPWLATLVKERTANQAKDDPHVRCLPDTFLRAYSLPHLLKVVHTPGLLIMLSEVNASYRQVFTDGRPLPQDPTPSWQGYSSAKWDGDALVIDSIGFRDGLWIDWNGSEIGEAAKVREWIRRPDYGHLDIEVTVDDPKAYTKPWTITLHQRIIVDTELVDEVCLENERSAQRMK